MTNLLDLSLAQLVSKVKSKDISSKEITATYVERSKKSKKLNSYVEETFESALNLSEKFDMKPDFNKKLPGIPFAIKDLFAQKRKNYS